MNIVFLFLLFLYIIVNINTCHICLIIALEEIYLTVFNKTDCILYDSLVNSDIYS